MKRAGGILEFDLFQPGIFTGRLIKMTMDTNIAVQTGPLSGRNFYLFYRV